MIIRNFPKQTNNLLPFELNSNKFSSYYGYPNYGYTGSYQILNFLLHKMETFYKPPLETQECLNQFIVPVFKEVQE